MRNLYSLLFSLLLSTALSAQNDVQYTHFLFNKLAFNPAYAGSGGVPTANALYRNQWLNVEGAPTTATVNLHTPFFGGRSGFGLGITADRVGMTRNNTLEASYAYRFSVSEGKGKLSLGINGRLEQGRTDWTDASPLDIGDGSIPNVMEETQVNPNFGLGIYYEQSNFYLGFSLPQLLNTSIYRDFDVAGQDTDYRTYYLMTGYLFSLSNSVKLQPGAMFSWNAAAPLELDLNAHLIFMDALWLGGNYRLGDAYSAMAQYQFSPNFRAGISFDFTMTALNSYTNGSMEVLVSYTFNKKTEAVEEVNHLRFF
ncbi:MAG: type IX secretion system membrane protein PorP/SprF [Bacteroidota bacterium]